MEPPYRPSWPIPIWPFKRDKRFKASHENFEIIRQGPKCGYIEDPFYEKFDNEHNK